MSPITQRRLKNFLKQRRAQVGLVIFGFLLIFSMGAEIWSDSVPIIMRRDGKTYFPILFSYSVNEFAIEDSFVIDYKKVIEADKLSGKDTFAIFPANRWDALSQTSDVLAPPSASHWLGTDGLGRDVMARLLYGIRMSLTYGILYWLFSFLFGITMGSLQGFYGGTVDFTAERAKELAEIIPFLPTVIIVNGLMKSQSIWVSLFVVVAFAWIGISAQIRAQFLALRKRDYVEAARALGASNGRIIFSHILPNAIAPALTLTPFAISGGISILAILDFLGFGLNPPTPSLGELLQQGRAYISNAPWLILSATAALCLMLISINLIGESLRQAFDPRAN